MTKGGGEKSHDTWFNENHIFFGLCPWCAEAPVSGINPTPQEAPWPQLDNTRSLANSHQGTLKTTVLDRVLSTQWYAVLRHHEV